MSFVLPILLAPALAAAQEPSTSDSSAFRKGQWAAQFGASSGFASLGVLKFTAPTRAWLLDARLNVGHQDLEFSRTNPDTTIERFGSNAGVTLRVGRRFHRSTHDRVFAFHSLGVTGGFTHSASGESGSGSSETNGWSAGIFFELGGGYLVTRRLSLGVIGSVAVSYGRAVSKTSTGLRSESSSYGGSLGGVSLVAALYF